MTRLGLAQYGGLALPVAFAGFPLYVLAPDFYATEYGVSLSTLGIALLALRMFDAIQDPLIGVISDRYRRHSMVLIGGAAVVLVLGVLGLFTVYVAQPIVWFCLCMAFAVSAYSVITINLNTLGALAAANPEEQTRITAVREAMALVGLVSAVTLPTVLSFFAGDAVYLWFGALLALCMAVAFVFFRRWYHAVAPKLRSTIPELNRLRLSAPVKRLVTIYALSMIASSIPAVLVIFFVRDLLGVEAYMGLFLMLYFLSGAAFMPLWRALSQRIGKYQSWAVSMILACSSFVWAFGLGAGDVWQYAVICIASGAALGADMVFPPSLLADHLHNDAAQDSAARQFATLTLVAKAALAIASVIALPSLEQFGFAPNRPNSETALWGLSFVYAVVPCALKAGAAILIWCMFIHPNKRDRHEDISSYKNSRSHHHA